MLNKPLLQPLCELLGDHLSSLDLFHMLTNEAYKELVTSLHIIRAWMCRTCGGSVLWGSGCPSGTSFMHTLWHDLALGESNELLAELRVGQSVWSAVASSPYDAGHLVRLTFWVHQLISGLCSTSHICPRIMLIQLIPVTWKVAHSE